MLRAVHRTLAGRTTTRDHAEAGHQGGLTLGGCDPWPGRTTTGNADRRNTTDTDPWPNGDLGARVLHPRPVGGWAVVAAMVAVLSDEEEPVRPVLRDAGAQEAIEGMGPTAEPSTPRGTVLVAEDETSLRESLVELLSLDGYEVLQAVDGEEALRVLSDQPVDVLILDMAMPKVDGLGVLEALRPPQPKVIVLSAFAYYSPEQIEDRGLSSKVTRVLRKPCPPVEFLAAVNDTMDELHRGD